MDITELLKNDLEAADNLCDVLDADDSGRDAEIDRLIAELRAQKAETELEEPALTKSGKPVKTQESQKLIDDSR